MTKRLTLRSFYPALRLLMAVILAAPAGLTDLFALPQNTDPGPAGSSLAAVARRERERRDSQATSSRTYLNGGTLDATTIAAGAANAVRPPAVGARAAMDLGNFVRPGYDARSSAQSIPAVPPPSTAPAYVVTETLAPVEVAAAAAPGISPDAPVASTPDYRTSILNAIVDQALAAPAELVLARDGVAREAAAQPAVALMRVSGTGTLVFADPADATPFSVEGTYVVELSPNGEGRRLSGGLDVVSLESRTDRSEEVRADSRSGEEASGPRIPLFGPRTLTEGSTRPGGTMALHDGIGAANVPMLPPIFAMYGSSLASLSRPAAAADAEAARRGPATPAAPAPSASVVDPTTDGWNVPAEGVAPVAAPPAPPVVDHVVDGGNASEPAAPSQAAVMAAPPSAPVVDQTAGGWDAPPAPSAPVTPPTPPVVDYVVVGGNAPAEPAGAPEPASKPEESRDAAPGNVAPSAPVNTPEPESFDPPAVEEEPSVPAATPEPEPESLDVPPADPAPSAPVNAPEPESFDPPAVEEEPSVPAATPEPEPESPDVPPADPAPSAPVNAPEPESEPESFDQGAGDKDSVAPAGTPNPWPSVPENFDPGAGQSPSEPEAPPAPVNVPPSVSVAGSNPTLVVTSLPASAAFSGAVGDDGLPGPLTVRWTKVSGPGSVLFSSPTASATTASFSAAGNYVLRLTADDTAAQSWGQVAISILLNQAPSVNAGADATVTLPASLNLTGWVSDDGVPDDQLTILWSQISGPGATVFSHPSSAATTATFPNAGTYVLRLRASDRDLTASDNIVVTVSPESEPEPEPPTGKLVYVATNGNDGNAGTQAAPYRTLKKALENVKAGDTVVIRGGVYNDSIRSSDIKIPSGESWAKPITVRGATGEKVTLRPSGGGGVINLNGNYSYLIFRDLVIDAALAPGTHAVRFAAGANHNRLDTVEIMNSFGSSNIHTTGAGSDFNEFININSHGAKTSAPSNQYHGIYIKTANNLIEGGTYHNNHYGYGVHVFNSDRIGASRNVVRNVRVYNNRYGMVLGSGYGNVAYNNIIYDNTDEGAAIGYSGVNTVFSNNIVIGTTTNYAVRVLARGVNAEIRNNIFWGNGNNGVRDQGAGTVASHNLTVNPMFVDPAQKDFRLQAGSPAVNAGMGMHQVTVDINGVARPKGGGYDIGPYER